MFYLGTRNLILNKLNNKIIYETLRIQVDYTNDFEEGNQLNRDIVEELLPSFYKFFINEGIELIKQAYSGLIDKFYRMPKEVYNYIFFSALDILRSLDEDEGTNVLTDIATEAFDFYRDEIRTIDPNDDEVHVNLKTLRRNLKNNKFIIEDLLFYDNDFVDLDMNMLFNPLFCYAMGLDSNYFLELVPFDMRNDLVKTSSMIGKPKQIQDSIDIFVELRNSLKDFSHAVAHHKVQQIFRSIDFDEKAIQIHLYTFFNTYFRQDNIDVTREKDTGRGWLDFSFSIGKSKVLLEIKVDKNSTMESNLEFQLLTYMHADRANYGVFALIITSDDHFNRIAEYKKKCEERGKEEGKEIAFIPIDAREKPTASKVKKIEDVRQ